MIAYLAGWSKKKDGLFRTVADAEGAAKRLALIGLSLRGFPESRQRALDALRVAKKKPKSALARALKFGLIWAQYNWSRRYFSRHPDVVAVCWNGLTGSRKVFMDGARDAGVARLYAELAPFPGRVTLDHTGVNAKNSLPREPEFYRDWAKGHEDRSSDGWRALGANLTARRSRRSDVGQAGGAALRDERDFLFCPLQVPNDSQITLFADWVRSVEGMLAALANSAKQLPDGWHIRVKEHPSAKLSLAQALSEAVEAAEGRIIIDNQTDTFAQVAASRGVVTINSSVGLQAFFYDKPVITLGQAFFALPGLVTPVPDLGALGETLAGADSLKFDPVLRAAFMNYLDQVYYPRAVEGPDGALLVDASDARAKLCDARMALNAASALSQPNALR